MKFLRLREVMGMTALAKSTIYKRIAAKEFPAPVKDGSAARWPLQAVEQYMQSRQPAAKG